MTKKANEGSARSQLTLSIQTVKLSNAFKNRIFIRNNLKLELIEVSYLIVSILQDEKKDRS